MAPAPAVLVLVGGLVALALIPATPLVGHPAPAALAVTLTVLPTSGRAPLTVEFGASLTPFYEQAEFNWSFGDGVTNIANASGYDQVEHTYPDPGTYLASVAVTGPDGRAGANQLVEVGVPLLQAAITATPSNGLPPLTVELSASISGGTGTYRALNWTLGDGSTGSGLQFQYTYSRPGLYRVHLLVTDSSGQETNASTNVTVGTPDAPAGPPPWGEYVAVGVAGLVVAALLAWILAGSSGARRRPPAPPAGALAEAASPALASPPVARPTRRPPALPAAATSRTYERILTHLYWTSSRASSGVASPATTREGIARELRVDPSTVSRALTRLIQTGAVEVRREHVPGAPRRLAVYALTPEGSAVARSLAKRVPPTEGGSDLPPEPGE